MPVNNFKIIRSLLDFRSPDDFYFVQVLQRKKDAKEGIKVNGTNNNSRLVKAYYVSSLEYFDFIEKELIILADLFNARVGIDLNRKSYRKNAFLLQEHVARMMLNEDYTKVYKAYSSVTGKGKGANEDKKNKKWIIDLDTEEETSPVFITKLVELIRYLQPEGDKLLASVPSKNGIHLITSPFRVDEFKRHYPKIEVHKNNPTNLYIP